MGFRGSEPITDANQYIYMRDVAARIQTLEGYVEDTELIERYRRGVPFDSLPWDDTDCLDESEADELLALRELDSQVSELDATLISENAFTDYARDYAEDVSDCGRDNPLYAYVDWDQYAADLQTDYDFVEFMGTTYYYLGG